MSEVEHLKWCGPAVYSGMLCICHLNMMARAVVNADQGTPGIYHHGATLVGWLGQVWTRHPGLTEVLDQQGCPDFVPIHTIKVESEHKL